MLKNRKLSLRKGSEILMVQSVDRVAIVAIRLAISPFGR